MIHHQALLVLPVVFVTRVMVWNTSDQHTCNAPGARPLAKHTHTNQIQIHSWSDVGCHGRRKLAQTRLRYFVCLRDQGNCIQWKVKLLEGQASGCCTTWNAVSRWTTCPPTQPSDKCWFLKANALTLVGAVKNAIGLPTS
eukprot:3452741-Rhodomonas_salina.1